MAYQQTSFKQPGVFDKDVHSRLFLYILMADTLSRKLTAAKNDEIIPGIKSASGVEAINHALFANDTFLLGGPSLKMARVFAEIMQHFCIISGAFINNRKSVMYG